MKKLVALALVLGLAFAAVPAYAHGPSNSTHGGDQPQTGHWTYDNGATILKCPVGEKVYFYSLYSDFFPGGEVGNVWFSWRAKNGTMFVKHFEDATVPGWPNSKWFIMPTQNNHVIYARTWATEMNGGIATLSWGCV